MSSRLVVALDVPDAASARVAAAGLHGHADVLKIGLELFAAEGPTLVREFTDAGWGVFLDLKLHDIPATVERAVSRTVDLGVELLTLHASGGPAMLAGAATGRGDSEFPRLLGVTVLTSMDAAQMQAVGLEGSPAVAAERLARVAHENGCDGVVASVHEAAAIKAATSRNFLVVTPGIRPAGSAHDDQARVATPALAVSSGADYLVVGRPIMRATDPAAAADAIRREMEAAFVDG
ncbi:MAG: orotidine-5'-phosphate decarboxylase [Acidobacteria bacterium]|nr:orotidine-5'-phosphate decarboxylase [Acidobacteriota bacterium]